MHSKPHSPCLFEENIFLATSPLDAGHRWQPRSLVRNFFSFSPAPWTLLLIQVARARSLAAGRRPQCMSFREELSISVRDSNFWDREAREIFRETMTPCQVNTPWLVWRKLVAGEICAKLRPLALKLVFKGCPEGRRMSYWRNILNKIGAAN